MPQVAISADAYALDRIGIFFTANNQTPADGNLTGQCVTLNKWFLAEMTDVPSPFKARGDARYVGDKLVAEGHAVEVPYDQRKPGDFVIYKYGEYGHIGVLLSGDKIFEQNVNVGGVARKLITEGKDSWYVYASRIGSLNESWRPVRPNIYRIKSYKEGDVMRKPSYKEVLDYFNTFIDGPLTEAQQNYYVARGIDVLLSDLLQYNYDAKKRLLAQVTAQNKVIADLTKKVAELSGGATAAEMAALQKQLEDAKKVADKAQAEVDALKQEKLKDEETGNAFLRWIGNLLRGGK